MAFTVAVMKGFRDKNWCSEQYFNIISKLQAVVKNNFWLIISLMQADAWIKTHYRLY